MRSSKCGCLLLTAPCSAQIDIHMHTATRAAESHIGNLTGHSEAGKQLYRRFCIGVMAQWRRQRGERPIFGWRYPSSRLHFGLFKCRLPSRAAFPKTAISSTRLDVVCHTGMPSWGPLTDQDRADLVRSSRLFLFVSTRRSQRSPSDSRGITGHSGISKARRGTLPKETEMR